MAFANVLSLCRPWLAESSVAIVHRALLLAQSFLLNSQGAGVLSFVATLSARRQWDFKLYVNRCDSLLIVNVTSCFSL
jgi:hypothetical protein